MSWSDYHLTDPFFCTPLPVMRGLVSAACERREALDSAFHASCVSSGASAVAESVLTGMLCRSAAAEIPFRRIEKEAPSFVPYDIGVSRYFSFMHMFDAFLRETLEGGGQRNFTDSAGNRTYDSLNSIASAFPPLSLYRDSTADESVPAKPRTSRIIWSAATSSGLNRPSSFS